ncbi:hypothetical protein BBFL7_00685 [Flavobacteria bacterium BBFL7]|nr:hypothetical protein BBFL7_00685 [Flavobacteria bacterium BBFL7]
MKMNNQKSTMKQSFFIVTVFLLLIGCSSQQELASNTVQSAALLDYSVLQGQYENGVHDDPYIGLWRDLKANKTHFQKKVATVDTYVDLKMIDGETLQVQLCSEGQELDQMVLKGKADKFYFHINARANFIPIPFFLWSGENRTAIGNDMDGNLILLQGQYDWYYIFFLIESDDYEFIDATYPKYETDSIGTKILKPKTDLRF